MRGLGDVPLAHRDLVTFATGVFLADRTVIRPKGWRRAIELEVPVYDVAGWEGLSGQFAEILEILSADSWQLSFAQRPDPKDRTAGKHPEVDRVLLFSGGADSLCGAIDSWLQLTGAFPPVWLTWTWAAHRKRIGVAVSWSDRRFVQPRPKET